MFRDGHAVKGLSSNKHGFIRRVAVDESSGSRTIDDESSVEGNEDVNTNSSIGHNRSYRDFRHKLLEFSSKNQNQKGFVSKEEPKICTVHYVDGSKEELDLSTLDVLLLNKIWRLQILMIQGYISLKDSYADKIGRYASGPKPSYKEDALTTKAHEMAMRLAKFIEGSFRSSTDTMLTGIGATNKLGKEVRLVVHSIEGGFRQVSKSSLSFTTLNYVELEVKGGALREMENYVEDEKKSREESTSNAVEQEFLKLLRHAERRQITVQASFAHFDSELSGYVTSDMLLDGLHRLGIGVTESVSEIIVERIGGIGSRFFDVDQLTTFYQKTPINFDGLIMPGNSPLVSGDRYQHGNDVGNGSAVSKSSVKLSQLKGVNDVSASDLESQASGSMETAALSATNNKRDRHVQLSPLPVADSQIGTVPKEEKMLYHIPR